MHQNIAAILTVGAVALGLPAQAHSGPSVPGAATARSFLPVYTQYAAAIQEHGLKGLESETAPGFTVRHGHQRWTGASAFSQANGWLANVQGSRVAVTIRRVTDTGKTAVVLTREALTFPLILSGGHATTATVTWYWKQTWHRTGQGWKLAVQEPISEEALGPAPSMEYTVYAGEDSVPKVSSPGPKTL